MEENNKKLIEKFEADFRRLSSKEDYNPEELERMKNLQKLMYYLEVRCAMKEGADYPGQQYMDDRSYDSRSSYMRGMPNRNSGHYPMDRGYGSYNAGMSNRYYRDTEQDKFVSDLHRMMGMETDPAVREHMSNLARMLEMK